MSPTIHLFLSLGLSFDMTAYYGLTLQSIPLQWHYYTHIFGVNQNIFALTNNQCLRNDNQFSSHIDGGDEDAKG